MEEGGEGNNGGRREGRGNGGRGEGVMEGGGRGRGNGGVRSLLTCSYSSLSCLWWSC